ncbi:hypothetical protein SAMN05216567_10116 [Variovorax sp. OK605]|uniref:hypothetical protein n=1 Tax=Variovorax sp. OK605 TaxID=1855317 RepID=UPI0008E433B6|nr:hypothetical protein [Variovorax sp. OK605]SFO51279.1 hypothetical protein SAMN05216567_10116 [Variovorax sp. OK605]
MSANLLDGGGNHWTAHGQTICHRQNGNPGAAAGVEIDVYSYHSAGGSNRSHRPFVLLVIGSGPSAGILPLHITPNDARALATAIHRAAATADAADAAVQARRRSGVPA